MRIYERLTPLNARERRSAEKHHTLLTTYIKRHNLDLREFYDVCVFGYPESSKGVGFQDQICMFINLP